MAGSDDSAGGHTGTWYDALGRRTEKQHISPYGKPYNPTKFLWGRNAAGAGRAGRRNRQPHIRQ
ncbi:hypothetical protein ACVXG8_00575 [Escherichia coli]